MTKWLVQAGSNYVADLLHTKLVISVKTIRNFPSRVPLHDLSEI